MALNIPEEYEDKEYPVSDYVQEVINKGVARALERKEPYPMPEWFVNNISKEYGVEGEQADRMAQEVWEDCISTALDSFGIKNPPTGNKTFEKDYEKYGFSKVGADEGYQLGDVVQLRNGTDKGAIPYHAVMVTGFDEEGTPLVSYADGKGAYNKNAKAWWAKGSANTYRYTGKKEDLDALESRNADVERKRQASMNQDVLKPEQKVLDTKRADTVQFLNRLADRYRK